MAQQKRCCCWPFSLEMLYRGIIPTQTWGYCRGLTQGLDVDGKVQYMLSPHWKQWMRKDEWSPDVMWWVFGISKATSTTNSLGSLISKKKYSSDFCITRNLTLYTLKKGIWNLHRDPTGAADPIQVQGWLGVYHCHSHGPPAQGPAISLAHHQCGRQRKH